jgi:hypothetical protein
MNRRRRWAAMWLLLLLPIPKLALAQVADDGREKTEKVSEILVALQAEPGKRIADIVRAKDHKGGFWLIVARKPARQ